MRALYNTPLRLFFHLIDSKKPTDAPLKANAILTTLESHFGDKSFAVVFVDAFFNTGNVYIRARSRFYGFSTEVSAKIV